MNRNFGEKWFKDRRTHPSNVPSNVQLQCSIILAFYEGNADMVNLVETELARADERVKRIDVDSELLLEFFASSIGVRAGAWAEIEGRYMLIRERLQLKLRAQKCREKKKEDKMLWSEDSEGDDSDDVGKGKSNSSETVRNMTGSSKFGPNSTELREDSTIAPLKSVHRCVKDLSDASNVLIDPKKRTADKLLRLESLFDSFAGDLENRIGVKVVNQDAEVIFMLGALNVIEEMVPETQGLSDRLTRLNKQLMAQGSVYGVPLYLHKSRISEIEKLLREQQELMGEYVKRWTDKDDRDLVISSAQLEEKARSVANMGEVIVRELDEVTITLSRQDVLWVLGRMSVWYARSIVISSECYRGSSLKRIGERVSIVAGK
jgi:hypothetical protein